MLDSGAYANVFYSDIAKVLEIDLSRIKEQEVFYGVEQRKRDRGYALLGRQFFFDQFSEVRFNYTNNKFYLIVNK